MCEETREVRKERRTIALSDIDEGGIIVKMWDALVVGSTEWYQADEAVLNLYVVSLLIQYVELRDSSITEIVVVEVVKGELGLSCWQSLEE